jgi:hypothetical protein
VEKHFRAGQAIDDNMAHAHCCWITKATNAPSEYVTLIGRVRKIAQSDY